MSVIHIFLVEIAPLADINTSRLSVEERERMLAIGSSHRRRQFAYGRRLLRHALAYLYGNASEAWTLIVAESGRPFLVTDSPDSPPAVSLSHSGRWIACAVAEVMQLGIDIEIGKPRNIDSLSEAVLDVKETAALRALPEALHLPRFYELWCLKEALAKALGLGMALSFSDLGFSPDNRLVVAPEGVVAPGWEFRSFRSLWYAEQAMLAVAWSSAENTAFYPVDLHRVEPTDLD